MSYSGQPHSLREIFLASERRAAAQTQQVINSPCLTHFVVVQKTQGHGYTSLTINFDVGFLSEPTFSYGSAMVAIDQHGYVATSTAGVLRWVRDRKGIYTGAQVYLVVDNRVAVGFSLGVGTGGGSASPRPTVAHHLTFAGPAYTLTAASVVGQIQTSTPQSTGLGAT